MPKSLGNLQKQLQDDDDDDEKESENLHFETKIVI